MYSEMTDIDISSILNSRGIRPSLQRIRIYQYLCNNAIHPTAETVYTALASSIPTLSRTTVYNTLRLFYEHYLVQTINIENDEMRYDADTTDHLHFKCSCCGEVYDVPFTDISEIHTAILDRLPSGFEPNKIQTFIWGICAHCRK